MVAFKLPSAEAADYNFWLKLFDAWVSLQVFGILRRSWVLLRQ